VSAAPAAAAPAPAAAARACGAGASCSLGLRLRPAAALSAVARGPPQACTRAPHRDALPERCAGTCADELHPLLRPPAPPPSAENYQAAKKAFTSYLKKLDALAAREDSAAVKGELEGRLSRCGAAGCAALACLGRWACAEQLCARRRALRRARF
jgi:hypothetical protein